MWAGLIALVNQQLSELGKPTIGFINPTIYAKNVTASYATGFHDITAGKSGIHRGERLRPGYRMGQPEGRAH